uniref:Peptide chain release factor domain-containing protein n=1 Tax=Lactuca sativa TaxID=4236 RepID=A0A9R1W260_LACSA|nr:hypothetical protein LSAT_V11C300139900 [Lactuca sativa]
MRAMAYKELEQALKEEGYVHNLLLKALLPKDDADERDCILEVRAGTGGEEPSLFAMDMFKMYESYSLKKVWRFEVVDVTEDDRLGNSRKKKGFSKRRSNVFDHFSLDIWDPFQGLSSALNNLTGPSCETASIANARID